VQKGKKKRNKAGFHRSERLGRKKKKRFIEKNRTGKEASGASLDRQKGSILSWGGPRSDSHRWGIAKHVDLLKDFPFLARRGNLFY